MVFFKEIDSDAICTNRSPLYKRLRCNSLNIERAGSFYTHAPTNMLIVNTNDIIDSFLNDSDCVFKQIDLNTICLNHTPSEKRTVRYIEPAKIKSNRYQPKY